MTAEEIAVAIQKIEASAGDFEAQHSLEDDLYHNFVKHVASLDIPRTPVFSSGPECDYWLTANNIADICSLIEKAKMILKTKNMDFERWYA